MSICLCDWLVTDDLEGRCLPCNAQCLRCVDLPSVCTQCVDGFELFSHSCIVPCAQSQFRTNDGRLATSLHRSVQYCDEHVCVSVCLFGWISPEPHATISSKKNTYNKCNIHTSQLTHKQNILTQTKVKPCTHTRKAMRHNWRVCLCVQLSSV